ncbi:circularly permuted type 2 ATP-grasp protein [Novosphingobium flavum]|uniref:Circularly permuted type 2 ATP-grasp protein n=1 Tax=Novosphingobium flavum TaxID=1778672 RepID=A0A7X1KMV2_9SPHN|nr:circularly permuted type 2 ATP-grasp protein [Novosphingobium flavum]MBC2667031.1 circularly permuted type 2 ATP-grasp protein [Novosphingobium flavum]
MATEALAHPASARLQDYPVDVSAGDLFRHAPPDLAASWLTMADGLRALTDESGLPAQELVARQISDLGMSFRLTGDTEERPWQLTPMPLIIGAQEWAGLERGLIQRARLLEAVAADIYGPQQLIANGHLPAAVVTGSRFFARNMVGLEPGASGRGNHYIHVYAVDLARGPRGQWRVLGDRLRIANGIGYALENRLALARATGSLLTQVNTRRLAGFFSELRGGIARDCQRENPRIALLTPGRFNQSYPEQAHLARYLGFPLVEGRDLTVSDERLYVRTIAGPKRIDALWRWIDTLALDPLNFDSRSQIGVPDLFDAWARGGLEIANRPGVEVLEAPVFSAFLPRLFRTLLGEDPLLPNVATWWCGQPIEAAAVREGLDNLLVRTAFGQTAGGLASTEAVPGSSLSRAERETLFEALGRRPMDYCGQEIVQLSTTPALIGNGYEPRPFTLRAFVARGANGEWQVMPGGFARLSASGEIRTTLMGEGDLSADVCVVEAPGITPSQPTLLAVTPPVRRGGGILASQAADNLFWFGRYMERAEATVRVVRAVLGSAIEVDSAAGNNPEVLEKLVGLLVQWGALDPKAADNSVPKICRAALTEAVLPGGVASLFARLRSTGLSLRDRLASDFWRIASRPLPLIDGHRPGALLRIARELIERLSALSGLLGENFVHGPAWRFLDMGRRIERALALSAFTEVLAGEEGEPTEALGVLLDLADSQITYRSRYLTGPRRDPVLDMLLLDPDNPRALAFQLAKLVEHIEALPRLSEDLLPEAPLREARALLAPLMSLGVAEFGPERLDEARSGLLALSGAIAERYFLQYEKTETTTVRTLLA